MSWLRQVHDMQALVTQEHKRNCFNEGNKDFSRNKTDLAIFNNFGRGTCHFIAKNTPVCNNIAFFGKTDYLLFTVKPCFKYFYNSAVYTIKIHLSGYLPIKNSPRLYCLKSFSKLMMSTSSGVRCLKIDPVSRAHLSQSGNEFPVVSFLFIIICEKINIRII